MKQVLFSFILLFFFIAKNIFAQKGFLKISSKDSIESSFLQKFILNKELKIHKNRFSQIDSISEELKQQGYFYTAIDTIVYSEGKHTAFLTLGKKIDSIQLSYLKSKGNKRYSYLKNTIKIHISELKTFLEKMVAKLEKEGKSFSKIKLTNIRSSGDIITASILINESEIRTVDRVIIKGYENFPRSYLIHFLNLKKGIVFNKQLIQQISDNLKGLSFVEEIKPSEVLFRNDSTIVYLYIKKTKNNSFDGLLNLNSNTNNRIEASGNINLSINNILNSGERFHLNWNANGNNRQNFNLKFFIPYFFNTPISNRTQFEIHRQDSTFLNSKFNTSLLYGLSSKTRIGLSFENLNSTNILVNQTKNNISNFSSVFFGLHFSYQSFKKDIFLNPKVTFQLKPFAGSRNSDLKRTNQIMLQFSCSYIFDFNSKNSIYLRNETGLLFSENYLTNELYRIGGINSLRGFEQQSIFTPKFSFFNIEYRLLTSSNSSLYSITDIGFGQNIDKKNNTFLGYGIGYLFTRKKSTINLSFITSSNDNKLNLSIIFRNYF